MTTEGLRIELIDTGDQSFFDVGSADLRPEMSRRPRVITATSRSLPNKIAIEGHTDSRPYAPAALQQLGAFGRPGQRRAPHDGSNRAGQRSPRCDARLWQLEAALPGSTARRHNRRIAIVIRYATQ